MPDKKIDEPSAPEDQEEFTIELDENDAPVDSTPEEIPKIDEPADKTEADDDDDDQVAVAQEEKREFGKRAEKRIRGLVTDKRTLEGQNADLQRQLEEQNTKLGEFASRT